MIFALRGRLCYQNSLENNMKWQEKEIRRRHDDVQKVDHVHEIVRLRCCA